MPRSSDRRKYAGAAFVVSLILISACLSEAQAQRFRQYYEPTPNGPLDSEFFFVRLQYSCSTRSRCRSAWLTDWPDAEMHLLPGITRLTRVATGPDGRIVNLGNDELMDYPWLYAVEVGQ